MCGAFRFWPRRTFESDQAVATLLWYVSLLIYHSTSSIHHTVALSLVLFFRALVGIGHTQTRTRFSDMIHVKWNKDMLHFSLPPDTSLGQLRTELAAYTQLKAGSFKLVYKGAVMKDDSTPRVFLFHF